MTVSSSTDRATFPGNGVTTFFPLPFRFFRNADIVAVLVDNTTFVITPQSLGIHYTLTGAGEPEADGSPVSTLTMLIPPPSTHSLFVSRVMPVTQPTDIINQARFYPEIHENVFDRLTMLIQQAIGVANNSLQLDPTGQTWDAKGNRIINVGDPQADKDAVNRLWAQQYIANLLTTITGPINNSANVFYQFPDGSAHVVQDLASAIGASGIGYSNGTAVQTVKDRLGRVAMATDYTSIKAACDANLNVLVPPGVYNVTTLITLRDNQTVTFMPGAILTQAATGNAGIFHWPEGVKDALIQGPARLRGPAYGRTPVPAPSYPNSNGCIRITGTAANPVVRPRVLGVIIEGWDDYGIFSENAQDFNYDTNTIRDIGRDGIRIYGGEGGSTDRNRVKNIWPGFGGVAPNLNVYGITYTRRADNVATPTVTNPPPRRCQALGNIISDCPTWKGLDTHGGQDLNFGNNIIWNVHIAIGVDEGDTVGQTDSPPIRINLSNNSLWRGLGNPGGAGINVSSSGISNMGEDVSLDNNKVRGFGGVGTGGINAAYQRRFRIDGDQLIDCITAGINVPGNVRMQGMRISNPTIKNVLADGATPSLAAIAIQAAETDGCVDGATLVRESGTMFGFSIPTIASGFSFNIGGEITQTGTITRYTAGSISRLSGGSEVIGDKAYARVTSAGALGQGSGVLSSTRVSLGVYELKTSYQFAATTSMQPIVQRRSNAGGSEGVDVTAVDTFRVYLFNAAGSPADTEFTVTVKGI